MGEDTKGTKMSNEQDLNQIELSIADAKKLIKRRASLQKLFNNKDFKDIILEGYLKDEAVRLVQLKSDPNMETDERQKQVLIAIDGIGALYQHFQTIKYFGLQAEKDLLAHEEAADEVNRELN